MTNKKEVAAGLDKESVANAEAIEELQGEMKALKEEKSKKPAKKKVKYHKVIVTNILEPDIDLNFSYNGKHYHLKDGKECELSAEVVNHINGTVLKYTKSVSMKDGVLVKEYGHRKRAMCNILETFEKEI